MTRFICANLRVFLATPMVAFGVVSVWLLRRCLRLRQSINF